jgi:predicted PurR-regulated permease PerM
MVGIPPLISIIALVVGGSIAGFLGILIAVPVAAGVMEYLTDLEKEKYS